MNESVLEQVLLFASLPSEELQHLATTLRHLEVPPNTLLFREGECGDRFYLVLDGELEIIKALGTDDERLLRVEGPGDWVGEMSLLNRDGLRTASVRTRTAAHLLEITHADLDALLRRYPALAYDLARMLSMRLQEADNAIIRDLQAKNYQLAQAYQELQAAQAQIIEKQMLERELQMAREIQESMLPRTMPQLAGFDFGARIVPARIVGGDLYDFIRLSDDHVGIVVGDVSGKGVPAALFMALSRSLVRAEASRTVAPRETLQNVNQQLLEMNDAGMFVTLVYGVLHRTTGEFAYARAGHELPLVVDGSAEVSTPRFDQGQPLGLFLDPALDQQTIIVPANGMLLLYTDGVTEAIDPNGQFFGLERLREALRTTRHTSAQAVCDRLLKTIIEYRGTAPQADDIALIAVRSRGNDERDALIRRLA